MLTINVFDIVGEFGISTDCGQLLYEQIRSHMASQTSAVVDFAGVTIVTAPFLRSALGQLAKGFSREDVRRRLEISNLSPANMALLARVMTHSYLYYNDENYQRAVDAVAEEYLDRLETGN